MISNLTISDLEASLIASGYPMQTELNHGISNKDLERGIKLAHLGNGHDQFLTGIRVNFDLTATNKFWVEAERYRFLEFVSSQSTMHRLKNFNLNNQYIEHVDPRMIEIMLELQQQYTLEPTKENYYKMLYSNPCGFKLTARMTTNYRCLLNIYKQRHNHRLEEWQTFCKQLLELPFFKEFLGE